MDSLLGALWWIVKTLWSIVWLLIGGWVSTALQIVVVVLAIFAYKYGWRRAPYEAWRGVRAVGRWGWAWLRGAQALAGQEERVREVQVIREIRVKELGDVNLSSMLNVLMLAGLALIALAG